jgi:hypothetical protein
MERCPEDPFLERAAAAICEARRLRDLLEGTRQRCREALTYTQELIEDTKHLTERNRVRLEASQRALKASILPR